MRFLNHANIVATIADTASTFASKLGDFLGNQRLLGRTIDRHRRYRVLAMLRDGGHAGVEVIDVHFLVLASVGPLIDVEFLISVVVEAEVHKW